MRTLWWDHWFVAVLCGVAFFGFLALVIAAPLWQVVDMPWFGIGAVIVAVGAVVGAVIVLRIDQTWRSRLTIFALFLVGSVFVTLLAGNVMRGCNAWLDGSKGKTYTVPVRERVRKQKGLRQRLAVESWRRVGGQEWIYVPDELYDRTPDRVVITTRDGFFGWTWVESVTRAP